MRTRRSATIEDLRLSIDCLPRHTRVAMLEGIAGNDIIVGAYSNSDGICPMLAAHRNGGRTSLIAFAQAWDRLAFRGQRKANARRATDRELLILRAHLQASLLEDEAPTGALAQARHEHEALLARRERETAERRAAASAERRARPGDPHRGAELGRRAGWSWSRIVRRYDDYERLLERLDDERTAADDGAVRSESPSSI